MLKSKKFDKQYIHNICSRLLFSYKFFYSYSLALERIKKTSYDVVIVFDDLSNESIEFLEYLNTNQYPTRVFFLSQSCKYIANKLSALQSGADDCLSLPCDREEFDLRLNKLVYTQKIHPNGILRVGEVNLHPHNGTVESGGQRIPLRRKEFLILFHLFRHKNSVVTRDMLSEHIWGEQMPSPSTIDSYIRRIRVLLSDKSKILETVWGFGYRVTDKEKN
ncbi:MAG: response regulator transcription factor [Patescibacteria group bacterium]